MQWATTVPDLRMCHSVAEARKRVRMASGAPASAQASAGRGRGLAFLAGSAPLARVGDLGRPQTVSHVPAIGLDAHGRRLEFKGSCQKSKSGK